jgi:hypothetical protein
VIPALAIMGVVLVGVGLFVRDRHTNAVALIQEELSRRKASDITITNDWFDFDRDTLTYDVSYRMPSGERQENRCKVSIRLGADHEVYWQRPLA